ncbi:hypothetical protein Ae168Ps1_5399 [Pseudonocardia sp. Ae168_Ps1]|nr:hypothetical protein Ae168Ps1_5399 [Pseudonocardia sp. Ae168_Ps1]
MAVVNAADRSRNRVPAPGTGTSGSGVVLVTVTRAPPLRAGAGPEDPDGRVVDENGGPR